MDFRADLRAKLAAVLATGNSSDLKALIGPDCVWDVADPVHRLDGLEAIEDGYFAPLRKALKGLHRRDEIVIGGENRRGPGETWVACVSHYIGNFCAPLWGISPSDRMVMLRAGEFYQLKEGRVVLARIIVDLVDLMRQAGRMPLPRMLGTELQFPGPATHDGVCPSGDNGPKSLDIVEGMLGDLHVYDPRNSASPGQTGETGYWAEDMLWWGPGGIGSNFQWEGFVKDHRASFLHAFPDRKGGNHYCRIGDGNYAAISGWPSMTMTHKGDYIGVPATDRALTLRVMDFYRCRTGKIAENWVLLDYVDLFRQMGVDLIARGEAQA